MKIMKFMMCFVATVTMLTVTSCDKDDDKTVTEAAANTLVINGKLYQLNSGFGVDENGRGYADATTTELDGNGDPKLTVKADVEVQTYNDTYSFPLPGSSFFFSIHDANYDYECELREFTTGTLTITKTETLFEYKVDGQTLDGQNVSFWISVPASEWSSPWK